MEHNRIIGRKTECERLEKCLKADQAQLVIVYGRRRVGKTFLINQFFAGRFDFKLTGAYAQPKETQLRYFSAELNRQSGKELPAPKDWIEAFSWLRDYLSTLSKGEKHVVFFDFFLIYLSPARGSGIEPCIYSHLVLAYGQHYFLIYLIFIWLLLQKKSFFHICLDQTI